VPGRKAPEETRREQILRAAYEVAVRAGIGGLTVRAVAARAKLSHALVLFHFSRKDELVAALLDRVIDATVVPRAPDDAVGVTRPSDRMRALLRREMHRLSAEPRHFRLFLEYWALGVRRPALRRRISAALDRYRAAFRPLAEEMLRGDPARAAAATPGVTPEGLAAVAVSFINGCAVQAMIDPDHFDIEQHLAASAVMLDRPAQPPVPAT
jgi:AcrR family transcriptional regulator